MSSANPSTSLSIAEVASWPADRSATVALNYWQLALILLILNAVSAAFFIAVVRRPVFDDTVNFLDVHRYATQPVTFEAIRHHINPTGPGSLLWMAGAARILGHDALLDARIAVLLAWLLLGAGMLVGARYFQLTRSFGLSLSSSRSCSRTPLPRPAPC